MSLSRGAAGICSSTLERLRGFTCLSEPSINPTYSERDQKTHEGSTENVILPKSQVPPRTTATHQAINKNSDFQPEQEKDGEEEDDEQEEDGPRQASFNKVPVTDATCLAKFCSPVHVSDNILLISRNSKCATFSTTFTLRHAYFFRFVLVHIAINCTI